MIEDAQRDETIVRHMVERTLRTLDKELQSEIIRELTARAKGSAIWTKMSIDLIERHGVYDKKDLINLLEKEICYTALPGLYAKLFSSITKKSYMNECLLTEALGMLAVAKRPLLVRELKWAMAMQMSLLGEEKDLAQLNDSADRSPVVSLLQPFIDCVDDENPAKSYVRFAHESIRELVLESSPASWGELNREKRLTHMGRAPRRGELEAKLLALRVEYLMLDEIDQKDLFNLEQCVAQDFGMLPFDVSDSEDDTGPVYYDPVTQGFGGFFAYAFCFWISHLGYATGESPPTISTITKLTKPESTRFRNWYQQLCRPDCTLQAKLDESLERLERLDPLVLISLYRPNAMLQELLRTSGTDINRFMSGSVETVIEEIILYGDISRLKCLIEHFQLDSPKSLALHNLMRHREKRNSFARKGSKDVQKWDECVDLVLPSSDQLIEQKSGNELLCTAVSMRCLPVVKKLFNAADSHPALRDELLCDRPRGGYRDPHPYPYGHQSVGVAVRNSDLDVRRYLLEREGIEAHLNHVSAEGYSVLHVAAVYGDLGVFNLLVPRLKAQVDRTNDQDDTALNILVFSHPLHAVECARVLLTKGGAHVSTGHHGQAPSMTYGHPLRQAVRGYMEMCHVLIDCGHADPRVALDVQDGEASLLDHVNVAPVSGTSGDGKERARDILATLCSLAGIKPPQEVGPRNENTTN